MFFFPLFSSWSTTPRREILMRRRWKWPVFGSRYVSAAPLVSLKLRAERMQNSRFDVYSLLPPSRKRTSYQSFLKSSHLAIKITRITTRGWCAFLTERTWTDPRWPCWSIKATRFHRFILPERRMNWLSLTSCSEATERRRLTSWLQILNNITIMLDLLMLNGDKTFLQTKMVKPAAGLLSFSIMYLEKILLCSVGWFLIKTSDLFTCTYYYYYQ